MSKWINFSMEYNSGIKKTDTYLIETKDGQKCIGQIRWYAPWRKYSFFPNPNTVFENDCLRDIVKFIDTLMLARKLKKQNGLQNNNH